MSFPSRHTLAFACTALVLSCAVIASRNQDSQLLRYRFTPGQVDRYSVDVRVKVDSAERIPDLTSRTIRGTGSTTVHVLKVNPDGSARIQIEVQPLRMTGAPPQTTLSPQIVTFTMTPQGEGPTAKLVRGRAVSARDLLVDPSALSRLGAILPKRPVRPGDRWTFTAPNPFQTGGTVTVSNRYFAPNREQGTPTVRIQQMMTIPIGTRLTQRGGATIKARGMLKVFTAVHFAPSLGKVTRTSSLGTGKITLGPEADKTGEDSATLTLNVDAVSELIDR